MQAPVILGVGGRENECIINASAQRRRERKTKMNEEIKANLTAFLLDKLVPALIIFIVGYILIKAVLRLEKAFLEKVKPVDTMLFRFVQNATKIALWCILLLEVLKKLGVNSASLLTVFAACGAAVALSLQGSLSNLAGGILILFTRPFIHGDYIECNGVEGIVQSTDLLYTTIQTADGKTISLPNSSLTNNTIINYSRLGKRRVEVKISVAYGTDLELAKKVILARAESEKIFLPEEGLTCDVSNYGASGIELMFRGWVKQQDYWAGYFGMNNALKQTLTEAGIEIPFPQLEVRTK